MKGCVRSRPYLPRTLGVGAALRMPGTPSTPWCSGSGMNLAHLGPFQIWALPPPPKLSCPDPGQQHIPGREVKSVPGRALWVMPVPKPERPSEGRAVPQGRSEGLPARRERHVHCPVAADHVVPEHVWSVHAEHNLWPWEDKAGPHVGRGGGRGRRQRGGGCSSPGPGPGPGEGNQNLQGRPLAWPTPESEPGCCPPPVIRHMEVALEPFREGQEAGWSGGDVREKAKAFLHLLYTLGTTPRLVGLSTKRLLVRCLGGGLEPW